jgi:hypothetical protein
MKTNEILEEIYRGREQHARECGYDIHVMFARMREHLKELEAQGWKVVSPKPREPQKTSYALRDEPQKKKRKQ